MVVAEDFLREPSLGKLDSLRKDDMLEVGRKLELAVRGSMRKTELKKIIVEHMVDNDVFEAGVLVDLNDEMARMSPTQAETEKDEIEQDRMKMEIEKARIEQETKLQITRIEQEAKIQMEVEKARIEQETRLEELNIRQRSDESERQKFDIAKQVRLIPKFIETEVDDYFSHFEKTAITLDWPKQSWSMLLQTALSGKAQKIFAALPAEDCAIYETVKQAILKGYELVPEAYRQKFRMSRKREGQTYVEFAKLKEGYFDKWCGSKGVEGDYEGLKHLVLIEELQDNLPEELRMYLSEREEKLVQRMAVRADEYTMSHKRVKQRPQSIQLSKLSSRVVENRGNTNRCGGNPSNTTKRPLEARESRTWFEREGRSAIICFRCRKSGHIAINCPEGQSMRAGGPVLNKPQAVVTAGEINASYQPFITEGCVSMGNGRQPRRITILRDTGASQSLICRDQLPVGEMKSTGKVVTIRGIENRCREIPVIEINLNSKWRKGRIMVGVVDILPISGVSMLLGNDLAKGRLNIKQEKARRKKKTYKDKNVDVKREYQKPVIAVTTRAREKQKEDKVSAARTKVNPEGEGRENNGGKEKRGRLATLNLTIPRLQLIKEQQADNELVTLLNRVQTGEGDRFPNQYFLKNGVMMRKWNPPKFVGTEDWAVCEQVVVPKKHRIAILKAAHELPLAGHLGVAKTQSKLEKHFYWPGITRDVKHFCKTCEVCQKAGKPNQGIPVAPLQPIPAIEEPFSKVIIDCVGPLPRTKAGNQYMLTVMCSSTRFPEAIPLRSISTSKIVKALLNFFTKVGLPKIIQTDRGSNFTSKLFQQVTAQLGVTHVCSSAYHPESQGALERFHATLKNMLRTFCVENQREWDEGVPFVMFAAREAMQESLGFSPFELVFGHSVRGPLKLIKEKWVDDAPIKHNLTEYVTSIRKKLTEAHEFAKTHLRESQRRMKEIYDRKAIVREFAEGEEVLVLLPLGRQPFTARYQGPYKVVRRIGNLNYVIRTPERRRKTQLCHINMMKKYRRREESEPVMTVQCENDKKALGERLYKERDPPLRLRNSEILENLDEKLTHLPSDEQRSLKALVNEYKDLFEDVPKCTNIVKHDVELTENKPIRQHPYRVSPQKLELIRSEINYMMKHGIIEASQSEWAAPCVLVNKSDGTPRFCTDYRKVNAITKADAYPIPRIDDCIDRIGRAKYITKFDLLKGYWAVPLTERAKQISAFVTPEGAYQYRVMPYGMRNSQATFVRMMSSCLADISGVDTYIDDIVIYSDTWVEHVKKVREVFQRLRLANLTINLAKSEFCHAEVKYLGHIVGHGKVAPIEAKIEAINKYQAPRTRREVRRFLGLAGYYRRFCKNYASITAPLTELLKKGNKFNWSAECNRAFEEIKSLLGQEPILKAPNFEKPFCLEIDASNTGLGAVLLQKDENNAMHPICYYSKKFNKCQKAYSTIEREALALMSSLQHFEAYIASSATPVRIYTDHNPLIFINRMKNKNRKILSWSLALGEFNIEIRHIRGKDNIIADALSRC